MARGFSSLTKQQRSYVSRQGGKIAQLKGRAIRLTSVTGTQAAAKSAAARRHKAVRRAAQILMEGGCTPEQLAALELTDAEYLRYGGTKRRARDFAELQQRIAALTPEGS